MARAEIDKMHRKARVQYGEFATDKDRAVAHVHSEIDSLLPILPVQVVESMLGGARGLLQVPGDGARTDQVRRMLVARSGTDGASVASVRLMLREIRLYASGCLGLTPARGDEACFPRSSALAHEIVAQASRRALAAGKGSQKGSGVGHHLRTTFRFAAEKLLWPIEVPRVALEAVH